VGISDIAADLEARSPSRRVGFGKNRHALKVFRVDIVAMPINNVAKGAVFEGALPGAA